MIKNVTIYGERCSGTNYLEILLKTNFRIEITKKYGSKHFFGFHNEKLKNSKETLFICITRDLVEWLNSLYRKPHHLGVHLRKNIYSFLNEEFYSYNDNESGSKDGKEIMEDRNIYTKERYKNIFEMRHTKLKFMIEDLPTLVDNYIFIRYEDLINDFEGTMLSLKNKGLNVKENIEFPINNNNYKGRENEKFIKKENNLISLQRILNNPNLIRTYEIKLGYLN
jgi:hypothetical protein